MADDRQPPQSYDTVSPAGVGASSSNVMSPRAFQDLFFTGDEGLIDVAMEEMPPDPLYEFMQSIPPADVIASWPDVTDVPPAQASSPAGVGSQASHSPSFQSPQTTPESSGARTPATPPSVPRATPPGVPRAAGARTAAGAGGNGGGRGGGGGGGGRGRRGPRTRGGRGGGRGGGGGAGGGGGGGGAGAGGAGGGGGGGGGCGGRRGRRRRLFPTSPASSTPGSSGGSGRQPRTLRQADLQRRLRMLLQDQEQLAQGREIANVTMTNSIVTSYKQGGAPSVQTSSSRISP